MFPFNNTYYLIHISNKKVFSRNLYLITLFLNLTNMVNHACKYYGDFIMAVKNDDL